MVFETYPIITRNILVKFEITNSLIGGNFHNIFVTIFVSSGFLGLISFILIIAYVGFRFVSYLIKSKKNSEKTNHDSIFWNFIWSVV